MLNLILYTCNMAESNVTNDSVAANRKKHDIDSATDILQRYVGNAATIKIPLVLVKTDRKSQSLKSNSEC